MDASDLRKPLKLTGHRDLAHRLVLSTLTGRPIQVSRIRPDSLNPGLATHEVSILRQLEAVTNGSHIEISTTGTTLSYRPGLVTGSAPGSGASDGVLRHELPATIDRGASYFLLPLCLLAPFSKAPVNVLFTGPGVITSATPSGDISVDAVRTAILPLYRHFGIQNNIELRTSRRSNPGPGGKGGGGEVQLRFGHQVRLPKTVHLLNPGRIKSIRGVAYCTGVPGSNNARMIERARGVLNQFASDTYIYSDVTSAPSLPSGDASDPGARQKTGIGFGLCLVAESSMYSLFSADVASSPSGGSVPEDVGEQCAYQLLENISQGGVVPLTAAPTVLTLMATGSEDVGRIQLGRDVLGSEAVINLARNLQEFGARGWGLRESGDVAEEFIVSVVGRGIGNVGRKIS